MCCRLLERVCVVWQALSVGVWCPPCGHRTIPRSGEKGRAERAAAFMGEAAEHEPMAVLFLVSYASTAKPLTSVGAGWRYFLPNLPPLHLNEQKGDV